MEKIDEATLSKRDLALKLIYSAACMDEALAELLKAEISNMKKCMKGGEVGS